MTIKYKSVLYASLLYGVITTLITAIQSETIQTDLIRAIQMLGQGTEMLFLRCMKQLKRLQVLQVISLMNFWL